MSQTNFNDPFAPQSPQWTPPARSSSKAWLIVLGVLGGSLLTCCGLCGGFGGFAIHTAFKDEAERLTQQYKDHPQVREKLGGIEECKVNYGTSIQISGDANAFDVRGPKGSGQLIAETGADDETFVSVKLRTAQGEWDLTKDAPGKPKLKGKWEGIEEDEEE